MYFQNKFKQIYDDCLEFADSKPKQNLEEICESKNNNTISFHKKCLQCLWTNIYR